MSEPLLPLPEPFAPAPRPLRAPGCGRGALIGCGVLIALFGVVMVGLALNKDRLVLWLFQRMQTQIEANLSPDVTPGERARLSVAFADLYKAINEGTLDPTAAQGLQKELFAIASTVDRGLEREQVLRLTTAIEATAGKRAPPGETGPAPQATPSP